MWYDINVPRKAQGLFSKNAEQLFLERHAEIVPLFLLQRKEKEEMARAPPARKKSETVLNCKIYRLIMVYAIGASAFLQVGFVMVREESIPSTDLSKNADAHATKVW